MISYNERLLRLLINNVDDDYTMMTTSTNTTTTTTTTTTTNNNNNNNNVHHSIHVTAPYNPTPKQLNPSIISQSSSPKSFLIP